MVDSSRLPPSQVTKPATPATVLGEQSARVTRLPGPLTVLSRAVRVEGEVVRQNTDGTVRINTPQGDMDVQMRGKQPQPGQRVEVDIPAGRPPRQVTIRAAPAPPPDVPVQNRPAPQVPITPQTPVQTRPAAPSQPQPQAPQQTQPQVSAPRPGVTPAPLPPQSAPPQTSQPVPLPPGTPVRFLPATPAQAQQIVQNVSQMMTALPTTATRVAFAANLIAQSAADTVAQPLLQTKPADINAIAQQLRGAPTLQPGVSFPSTPSGSLLQQILNLPTGLVPQAQTTTQGTALPPGAPAVIPATGNAIASPLATLIALTPALDTPSLPLPGSAARITQMDVRILSIQPPGVTFSGAATTMTPSQGVPLASVPTPAIMPNAPAGSVTAQVTGFTPQGLPLVTLLTPGSTLPQNFILQYNAGNLQVGSTLTLAPQNVQMAAPGTVPSVGAGMVTPRMAALLSLFGPGPWPVMDEAYQTLLQSAPQAAQAFARSLPSPGNPSQLGAAAMLFISAVRGGDIGGWLGDKKIDILQRTGKNSLLSRLTQDLSTLAQRTADTPAVSSDWRPVPLPLFWEGQVQKIALYVKQDGGDKDNEREGNGQTRFIFDLDLDRMGGVQLDGLVREKRFDLVVRTQAPLSEPMRQMMKNSYSQALQDTDLHGDLSFQGDIKNWVNVLQKEEAFGADA